MRYLHLSIMLASCLGAVSAAEGQRLEIWWAQWAPADGLARLGQAFTKQTGIEIQVRQIPWPDFQNQVFLEFGKDRPAFDLVVGDSQWLGRAATSGWYLDLTDWIAGAVAMDRIHSQAKRYLCEYPPGSGRIFAAPCETDAVGLAYRKDWFTDPAERAAFHARHGRELDVPKTWTELVEIAEFFQRPAQNRYGAVLLTGRGYDALTMGFQSILHAHGGAWADPATQRASGSLDSPGAIAAADFLKRLCAAGPPNAVNADYPDVLTAFNNGSTALMMTYFAFFPAVVDQLGERAGFAVLPAHEGRRVASLGGQGLAINAKAPATQQEMAKRFIAWFNSAAVQARWVSMPACFTADVSVLASEDFRAATPYNAPFADSMAYLQDFWNIPSYGELLSATQRQLGRILDGQADSATALKELATEHDAILGR